GGVQATYCDPTPNPVLSQDITGFDVGEIDLSAVAGTVAEVSIRFVDPTPTSTYPGASVVHVAIVADKDRDGLPQFNSQPGCDCNDNSQLCTTDCTTDHDGDTVPACLDCDDSDDTVGA